MHACTGITVKAEMQTQTLHSERTFLWNLLLYGFVSFLVTYFLHRRGRFKVVRKAENAIMTTLGVILTFVDLIETWFGYEYEGNPFVILTIELLAEGGWIIFVLSHVAASVLVVLVGWKGKSDEEATFRAVLFFVVAYLVILTAMNALFLWLYGVFK